MGKLATLIVPPEQRPVVCAACGHGARRLEGKRLINIGPLRRIGNGVYVHDGDCGKKAARTQLEKMKQA